jgi:hypothetical protein
MHKTCGAALMVLVATLAACAPTSTASSSTLPSQTPAPPSAAPATPSTALASPSPTPPVTTLASGAALPACDPSEPIASETVTFAAAGFAWALRPGSSDPTCLFEVEDSGPFQWGPLGDRALLGGLEVKGVAGGPSLPSTDQAFTAITWSRPTGKSIVYAPDDGTSLEKVHIDGTPTLDVTPLPASTYLTVAYHPSGEAFAFALRQGSVESIWVSSNAGMNPARLVFTEEGTTFGALGFDADGKHLLYTAQHADGHADLHSIDITDPSQAPVVWEGPDGSQILDIQPGLVTGTVAWTAGTSCDDGVAMAQVPGGTRTALPDATGPTRAVGWLDETTVLVATGGCDDLLDLAAVEVFSGAISPLVSGVDAAAVRTPVATPPAPLPANALTQGSGFS